MEEIVIMGVAVSEGIAIGRPLFVGQEEAAVPEFPIALGEVDGEIARYRRALSFSREDLRRLQESLEGSAEVATIIDAHIQMLEDPMMTTDMEEKIRLMLQNTEAVFDSAIKDYGNRISQITDPFFQQRMSDVMDLAGRILGHLSKKPLGNMEDIPPESVVFTEELTPSDAAAPVSHVLAFVSCRGGVSSHAALIARAKGIPYVSSIDISACKKVTCHQVVVDGELGVVIFNPTQDTLNRYQLRKRDLARLEPKKAEGGLSVQTKDGCPVGVYANFGSMSDLERFSESQADGIGLLRTEYLFLEDPQFIQSEERQREIYREIIDKMNGAPLVMRVFDFGGDKTPFWDSSRTLEENPALGCRGIRYLLRNEALLKTQLRALFRASITGDVRILLPLVSDIRELIEVRRIMQEIGEELTVEGVAHRSDLSMGCMIEVPSAVLLCDVFAKKVDFMAIGTNDLVQYTLGADRNNPLTQGLLYPAHPSVLRMIKMVVAECRRLNCPVSICGEMASNPLFIPLLLGLGVTEFSCSLRYLPMIKETISKQSLIDSCALAERILCMDSGFDIAQELLLFSRKGQDEQKT